MGPIMLQISIRQGSQVDASVLDRKPLEHQIENLFKRHGLGRGIYNGPVIEKLGGMDDSVQHIKCPDGAYRQQRAFSGPSFRHCRK